MHAFLTGSEALLTNQFQYGVLVTLSPSRNLALQGKPKDPAQHSAFQVWPGAEGPRESNTKLLLTAYRK